MATEEDVLQSMIDISAERLEGLRTQCATSAELTQHEIRTLEGKLIKLFAKQLMTRSKLDYRNNEKRISMPSIRQWLRVVGLGQDSIQAVCNKVKSIESLQEKSDHELRQLLNIDQSLLRQEEHRRLSRALHNLKKYTEILVQGDGESGDVTLYWDSWDNHRLVTNAASPRGHHKSRAARSSVPGEEYLYNSTGTLSSGGSGAGTPMSPPPYHHSNHHHHHHTPPTTPPINKLKDRNSLLEKAVRSATTPPAPRKRSQNNIGYYQQHHHHHQQQLSYQQNQSVIDGIHPLTKSKSHESQLANKHDGENNNPPLVNERRGRLATEPGPGRTSPLISSPIKSPPSDHSDSSSYRGSSLQVPKSPRTPTVTISNQSLSHQSNLTQTPQQPTLSRRGHMIAHRFTKTFKMMTTCDYCDKQMFIGTGLKCKECKYKCHKDCESKVPPSCCLPEGLMNEFKNALTHNDNVFLPNQSPSLGRPSPSHHLTSSLPHSRRELRTINNVPTFVGGPDSSSTSSCNSSTPSSPALVVQNHSTSLQISHPPSISHHHKIHQQFNFPDVSITTTIDSHILDNKSVDSDRTVSIGSVSEGDSERTPIRVDSQDSTISDGEVAPWPRQNSLSIREWDIPFDELKMGDALGTGHFGTVYRGNWHGDVAIKVLNMHYLDDEKTLEGFKLDVATFRKTRHENLILFMGACMKPPRLAIVTSMCKGYTLYTHIHVYKDKFNMNKAVSLAQQITLGMGYLHARGIVHKDLKTKNIFLENGRVIITDFGLFSVTKLCFRNRRGEGLSIPPGWLCYLSPEIVRSFKAHQKPDEELPFSKSSDIYAFGTVWYELLCGEWPFKGQPPEAIIWQVGKGMKQTLANLQASKDVKDILMMCWSYMNGDRPDFLQLHKTLEKLPKKRLARSPSHPIHLSRSAESVF